MISFLRVNRSNAEKPNIEETVSNIQKGDFTLREQFIIDYKPFILNCVSRYNHSHQNDYSSDEFSIALIAFNEAINTYKLVKGMSFLSFSGMVIKNRLNDYARKNRYDQNVISFESLSSDHDEEDSRNYEIPSNDREYGRLEVRDEINLFSKELKNFGIGFNDLVRLCPKHKETRNRLIHLAQIIFTNSSLLNKLRQTKGIPIKELLELSSVCRGTIEQHRKYIIALVLILDSNLDTMKSYINSSEGGKLHEDSCDNH